MRTPCQNWFGVCGDPLQLLKALLWVVIITKSSKYRVLEEDECDRNKCGLFVAIEVCDLERL